MIDSVVFFLFIGLSTFFQLVGVKMKLGFVSWPRRLCPRTRFVLTQITPMHRKTLKKKKKDIGELAPSMKVVYLFPSRFCMKIFFKASPGYIPI